MIGYTCPHCGRRHKYKPEEFVKELIGSDSLTHDGDGNWSMLNICNSRLAPFTVQFDTETVELSHDFKKD